jgi:Ca-activated chloride channel family protein
MTPTLRTDRTLIRAGARSTRYVLADLEAPAAPRRADRHPVNVALVLDRSGSMGGQKIRLARQAVEQALALLAPDDRFSLVVFDDEVDVLVASTLATGEARRNALHRLREVDARGSTNLGGGWQEGSEQIAAHIAAGQVTRCLLVTDGLANVGVTDPGALEAHVRALKDRGVTTSTFGVGRDFDEHLLQCLAQAGGGNFYFIETPQQIPDLLTSELGETLEVVARDAALVLRVPAGTDGVALGPFQTDVAGSVVRVNLGNLVSGQEIRIVIRLAFPTGQDGTSLDVTAGVTDVDGILASPDRTLTWTFGTHQANDVQARDRVVDRAVAEFYAAEARQQALVLNREGRFDEARRVLERVARRIASYAGDDPELRAIVTRLRDESEMFAYQVDALAAKRMHFAAYAQISNRTADGKSRRAR